MKAYLRSKTIKYTEKLTFSKLAKSSDLIIEKQFSK